MRPLRIGGLGMTEEGSALPRRQEIEAAIAAYNATGQEPLLTPKAVHLLSVMFAAADICSATSTA